MSAAIGSLSGGTDAETAATASGSAAAGAYAIGNAGDSPSSFFAQRSIGCELARAALTPYIARRCWAKWVSRRRGRFTRGCAFRR